MQLRVKAQREDKTLEEVQGDSEQRTLTKIQKCYKGQSKEKQSKKAHMNST